MNYIDEIVNGLSYGDRRHFIITFIAAMLGGLCKILFGKNGNKKPKWLMIIRELVLQVSMFLILTPIIHNMDSLPVWTHYAAIWACCYYSNNIKDLFGKILKTKTEEIIK